MKYYLFRDRLKLAENATAYHLCPVCHAKVIFTSHYDEATARYCCENPGCVEKFNQEVYGIVPEDEAEWTADEDEGEFLPDD